MMMIVAVLSSAVVYALATWMAGWWAVPLVAFVAGALWNDARAARCSALAATLGWTALLVDDARAGRISAVGGALAGVMRVSPVVLMCATLVFVAAAAWSAAAIASELRMLAVARSRR